jgi:glycopeptide antibiotics resistance protein
MGVAVGAWAGRRLWPGARTTTRSVTAVWVLTAAFVWGLILLVRHWYPFDFRLDTAFVRARAAELSFVPFAAYYTSDPFAALNEAIVKGLLSVPVGALLGILWPPPSASPLWSTLRHLSILTAAALFFAVIEFGQLLLPTRFPDITDVLIGAGGAALGMWLSDRYGVKWRLL